MNNGIVLNIFDDPKMSERQFVVIGEYVYARGRVEEFGLTKNNEYKVLDTNGFDLIKVTKDNGEEDWFSVEYFSIYECA